MAAIHYNYENLNFQPGLVPYGEKIIRERFIKTYSIRTENLNDAAKIGEAIFGFIQDNEMLPSFNCNDYQRLHSASFLIINERALSISKTPPHDESIPPELTDHYFSTTYLKNPIQCSQGHYLAKRRAQQWVDINGNICPAGNHPIFEEGQKDKPVDVVYDITLRTFKYIKDKDSYPIYKWVFKGSQKIATAIQREAIEEAANKFIKEIIKDLAPKVATAIMKVAGSNAFKTVAIHMTPTALKTTFLKTLLVGKIVFAGKGLKGVWTVATTIGKKIPVASIGFASGSAMWRFSKGEYKRGAGELVSGGLACVPIAGSGLSLGMDGIILGCDVYEDCKHPASTPTITEDDAYHFFDLQVDPPPQREEVERAYRNLKEKLESKEGAYPLDYKPETFNLNMVILEVVKNTIYQKRGW